ncbi:septum formation family protein [Kibdelosporangium persicum]|uniref:Septum formation n=1 Tax=Kibdelosporangium persicum TaxID=2698649 RepID=A0ABX2FH14_9PSEU|nr:Septum formation [Kibdelosporangium persicum]
MSTRLVMAGAFVGALLVLTLSMVFSWPVAGGGGGGRSTATDDDAAANLAAAFEAPAGSCLTWKPDGSDMKPVGCDQPHLFEVTGDVDISGEYNDSAPSPSEEVWRDIAKQKCTTGAAGYLGGKLDPFGKYSVGALKPSDEQWRDGDRKLRCGLQRATPSGKTLVATTGSAKNQDQSDIYDVGTCLALVEKNVGDPVPCEKEHAYEIVGVIDLSQTFTDGTFPSEEQQQTAMLDQCPKLAAEYSGNLDLAAQGLSLTWDTRKQESWDAGSHRAVCKVGAPLKDNSGLAPISGSVKGAGQTGQPATPPPSGSTTPTSTPGG